MKLHGNYFNIIKWLLLPVTAIILYFVVFKDSLKKIKTEKAKLSRSIAELSLIADLQLTYMENPGTDEKGLFNSLEGLNSEDLKEVFNQFGKKEYALGTYQGEIALIGENLNLLQWYNEELSGEDLKKMRKIWMNTGLTF